MKFANLLILICLFTSGCMSFSQKPPKSYVNQIRSVAIIAIESPPLLLHPETEADRIAIKEAGYKSPRSYWGSGIDARYSMLLPVFGFVGTAVIYSVSSSTPKDGEIATIKNESPVWMPSIGLTRIVSQTLQKDGRVLPLVIDGYAQLPIKDRSLSLINENWLSVIRRWFNSNTSMIDYEGIDVSQADTILEVGVANFEYYSNGLVLQVSMKLIDRDTKKVIGKSRNYDWAKAEPLVDMLKNQGLKMTNLIEITGEKLVLECLQDLELIE